MQSSLRNRRRRVRHKVHTPVYASFTGESRGIVLDLNEVIDISEDGASVQCGSPLELNRNYDICLDLAEAKTHIYTSGRVIWADKSGRVGFRFPDLPSNSLLQLRDWLFLNALASVVNAQPADDGKPRVSAQVVTSHATPRQDYTNMLTALSAVQRESETFGSDLDGALRLISARAQALVRATGAAIAVSESEIEVMICKASAGEDAPPVGARLHVGSGFSGECARTRKVLRCDDTETDTRVDRETCRILGIRAMVAAPIKTAENVLGIIEVFSPNPGTFQEIDAFILQRLAETAVSTIHRAAGNAEENKDQARSQQSNLASASQTSPNRVFDITQPDPVSTRLNPSVLPSLGTVPAVSQQSQKASLAADTIHFPAEDKFVSGVRLPRSHLVLLFIALVTIALALGFVLAPWIQERLHHSDQSKASTVLASSQAPGVARNAPSTPNYMDDSVAWEQLRQLAKQGDPAAQNALGVRYATGEGVAQDEREAAVWFTKAAEQGYVIAQSALGARYWAGRGVPQDYPKAYFWSVLARAGGDEGSKTLASVLASHMTRAQAAAIEQQADIWFTQHQLSAKSSASH